MKKTIFNILAIVIIAGFSTNVMAQTSDNAENDAHATIIAPITIDDGADLNFGAIIQGAGTVTLGTDGTRTFDNAGMIAGNQTGTVGAASFNVKGQAGYTYAVVLPTTATITYDTDKTMSITEFASNHNVATVLAAGDNELLVGAKLTVGATQQAGTYTGKFTVSVNYN